MMIVGACLANETDQAAGRERRRAVRPVQIRNPMLNETPMRGIQMPPTDPLIYRFYEL